MSHYIKSVSDHFLFNAITLTMFGKKKILSRSKWLEQDEG